MNKELRLIEAIRHYEEESARALTLAAEYNDILLKFRHEKQNDNESLPEVRQREPAAVNVNE